jgi:hypothetical protein
MSISNAAMASPLNQIARSTLMQRYDSLPPIVRKLLREYTFNVIPNAETASDWRNLRNYKDIVKLLKAFEREETLRMYGPDHPSLSPRL